MLFLQSIRGWITNADQTNPKNHKTDWSSTGKPPICLFKIISSVQGHFQLFTDVHPASPVKRQAASLIERTSKW